MSEFTLPRRVDLRRTGHRAFRIGRKTIRAGWVAGKILVYLAAGAGAAVGGWCMVSSSADILTSSDKVLLQVISAPPSPDARKPRGQIDAERDPFAPRRAAPEPPPTPEQSLWSERAQALVTFGMGLFVAFVSLFGPAAAWSVAAEALGFGGGDEKMPKA